MILLYNTINKNHTFNETSETATKLAISKSN